MNGQIDGWADEQTDEQMNGYMDGWADEQMDK